MLSQRNIHVLVLAFVTTLTTLTTAGPGPLLLTPQGVTEDTAVSIDVSALELALKNGKSVSVPLVRGGQLLELEPAEIYGPGALLQVETGTGDELYALDPGSYRGWFVIEPGKYGIAALTVHSPFISVFLRSADRVELIRTEYVNGAASYYASELAVPRKEIEEPAEARRPHLGIPGTSAHGTFVCGNVPLDYEDLHAHADVNYFWLRGYSVANVVNTIEADMNRLNVNIYEEEVCIHFRVVGISVHNSPFSEVLTSTDPVTLVNQFKSHFQSVHDPGVSFDIAHLFTGKNMNGGTIGYADAIPGRYAWTQQGAEGQYTANDYDRSILEAHEIGHNYRAIHDTVHHCVWTTCWKTIMHAYLFDLPMLDDFSDDNTYRILTESPKVNQ